MAGRLEGKVAVITGGASGIGRATALRFLAEGARVLVADYNAETGEETLALARERGFGEQVAFRRTDVAQEVQVEAAVRSAVDRWGRLDCIFNNAGVGGAFGPITDITVEDWDYTFAVLVRGVFLGIKHAARIFKRQGQGGTIINTASIAGLSGGDGPQAYSAAKAAVINLTRSAAIELAPDRIRVNAICPGGILTPLLHRGNPEAVRNFLEKFQPWPEAGEPEYIASVALFLASDESRFVTGAAIVADGGATAAGTFGVRHLREGSPMPMGAFAGVDKGTTGEPPLLRSLTPSE
ncbi:MAG: 2,5-dichloro-2,5-cyclohexadiene-1,4-diol dehydrogenase [Candidatus Binatia bacterium]|nr:MAG: 2,5-dichloro-2,5-cyclohexadiene-1,4-diol dehydrogenase [Candidatus Binatia bacterium]